MNSLKAMVGFFAAALMVVACSDDDQKAIEQRVDEPSIMKAWEGPCSSLNVFGQEVAVRPHYRFGGAEFSEAYFVYEDDQCKTQSARLQYDGAFTLGDEIQGGVRKLDLEYQRVNITALSEKGQQLLETIKPCGVETWPRDRAEDVTDVERGATCPFRAKGTKVYNSYLLDQDKLYLGESGALSEGGATEEKDRPTGIQRDKAYQPSEAKFAK